MYVTNIYPCVGTTCTAKDRWNWFGCTLTSAVFSGVYVGGAEPGIVRASCMWCPSRQWKPNSLFLVHFQVQQAQCNPDQPEYLAPRDFFVGGSIEIHKRLYHITGCDRFVLTHMEAHPGDYDAAVVEATRVLFAN